MLLSLVLLVIFLICAVIFWFRGLWNTMLILMNFLLSGLLSLNYFEPVAKALGDALPDMRQFVDLLALWAIFLVAFGILWALRFLLSRKRVEFLLPVELVGRSILALWCAWVLVGFVAVTLHTAPIGAEPLGAWSGPEQTTFFGLNPDRQWLALMQSRSGGALSRWEPQEFDPNSEFPLKYYHRRRGS